MSHLATMATSLKAASQSCFIKALGKMAASRYTCGGTLPSHPKVQLNYLSKDGTWNGATLPLADAELQELIKSADVASFRKGGKTVTDRSYALDSKRFTISFQLCDSGILGDIQHALVPEKNEKDETDRYRDTSREIRAELYKMNIYTAPNGHFKAHVDTPHGGLMFGKKIRLDHERADIQWAAFFSDVEHEIFPVTAGHCVTLTYNLYHIDQISPAPTADVTTSEIYLNLKAALAHPHFLRDGGTLGFPLQHNYVLEKFDYATVEELLLLLKGSDHLLLLAARALSLEVEVKPVVETKKGKFRVDELFYIDENSRYLWAPDEKSRYLWAPEKSDDDSDEYIIWSQSDPFIIAAILVTIPHWGQRKEFSVINNGCDQP